MVEGVSNLKADPESTRPDSRRAVGPGELAAILVTVVLLDQATKLIFVAWLGPGTGSRRWELVGRFLAFEYVENRGAAFGILAGQTWFLAALAVAVGSCFLALLWWRIPHDRVISVGVALIAGGALGNLLDRVRLGYVVDFIAAGNWPRFNVADSAITVGVVVLGYAILREDRTRSTDA